MGAWTERTRLPCLLVERKGYCFRLDADTRSVPVEQSGALEIVTALRATVRRLPPEPGVPYVRDDQCAAFLFGFALAASASARACRTHEGTLSESREGFAGLFPPALDRGTQSGRRAVCVFPHKDRPLRSTEQMEVLDA
jgi:hypothetical protein